MEAGKGAARGVRRSAAAALLLASAATSARARLVTVVSAEARASAPVQEAPVLAALPDAPASCARAAATIDALQGAIVEAQAQYWAYLTRQPSFASSSADIPGADIADPELKAFFYSRLRFWLRQDSTPPLAPETLAKVNDALQKIRMTRDLCGA